MDTEATMITEEIHRTLDALDEQLAQSSLRGIGRVGEYRTPSRSMLQEIRSRLTILQQLRAPLYLVTGQGIRRWIKQIVNLPILMVSSKQIIYNRELLTMLELLMTELESVRRNALYAAELARQQQTQITVLEATIAELQANAPK
jgi:hypothetical protein